MPPLRRGMTRPAHATRWGIGAVAGRDGPLHVGDPRAPHPRRAGPPTWFHGPEHGHGVAI